MDTHTPTKTIRKRRIAAIVAILSFSSLAIAAVSHETPKLIAQSEYKVERVLQELPMPKIADKNTSTSYWYDEEVQTGDNLTLVLKRLGVSENSIQNFLKESPIDTKMLQLRAGQIISVRVDAAGDVTDVQFFSDDDNGERNLVAIGKINGKWSLNIDDIDTETLPSLRSVVIGTSSTGSLAQAGVPVEIRTSLREVFSDKFNLDELKQGDKISILYESLYFRGQEIATGNILAAEITTGGKTYYGYYFENGDAGGNFYDEYGESLKKGFAGQPVESYTRISSPYGIRMHPTLKTIKMHTGIDYAAPTNTKILAPSDGIVTHNDWKGGYGKAIMLVHDNGMETLYAHMNDFVASLKVGSRVKAGDVIGYVGSTGRSTGPHVHYEVRINGQTVNPASVALPTPKLSASDLAALKKYQQKTNETMASVRGLPVMVSQRD